MQEVSDKELDKLFRKRFESWEVEPSEGVWAGIAESLQIKKNRSFPVMWIAAASIGVVVAVGIWMSSQREPMKLVGKSREEVKEVIQPQNSNSSASVSTKLPDLVVAKDKTPRRIYIKQREEPVRAKPSVNEEEALSSISASEQIVESRPSEQISPPIVSASIVSAPVIACAMIDPQMPDVIENTSRKRESLISSVVNYVVSKVDKRDDKIIELEDDEEGTRVKAVNLILLKFKPKNSLIK